MRLIDWLHAWWRRLEPIDQQVKTDALNRLIQAPRGTRQWRDNGGSGAP